jgi:hypothetical protein
MVKTEIQRLKAQNARYLEALIYARHQSHWGNQLRGIEESIYLAWIHEKTSKALGLRPLKR